MGWSYYNKPPLGWPIDWDSPLTKGLVGYWLMNEGGGSKVFDSSGNGNMGTLVADTHFVAGKFGGSALNFDGTGDYVDLIYNSSLSFGTGDFTLSAWIYPHTVSSYIVIFGKDVVGERDWDFGLGSQSGKLVFYDGQTDISIHSNAVLSANSWQQVIATRSGTTLTLYVDAKVQGVGTSEGNFTETNDIYIGAREYAGYEQYFDGIMDQLRIFNRALTASEIAQLYREPFAVFKDPDEIPILDQYYTVEGAAGIMTLNTGYWGPTY